MNLHISKALLITGISALTLFSCSKDSDGEVKSISKSFEKKPTQSTTEEKTDLEKKALELAPGEFTSFQYDEDKTATFHKLFVGGENFMWSFPGAEPASSTEAKPGLITFPEAGEYTVTLEVTIDDEAFSHSETIVFK